MQLNPSDQATIRERPQRTKLYLTIFEPKTIMKAQVNNPSIVQGARTINYDGIITGSYSSVSAGMTLLVGTAEGLGDVGKARIKSATATAFEVGENSNIAWADNLYLTVLNFWELFPVYPRIVQNAAGDSVTFFKDFDISYTNFNSVLGTFPCAGSNQGLFTGEQVYYSSTGTYNLHNDTLNFVWSFEGGTPASSFDRDPGFVTYPTAGDFVTSLTVFTTDSGFELETTYRYVSVRDRPGQGSKPPIANWQIVSDLAGSRDQGGYRITLRVRDNIPINENAVVTIFSEDWYGSTKQSFNASRPNNGRIFFSGYVLEGTIQHNWEDGYIEFEAGTITEVMKETLGYAISVESKANPTTWYELLDMDSRRALYHYLKWHSTVLSIADFQFLGNDQKIQFFDSDRTSMFDAIDNYMRNTLFGRVTSDRQGKIWAEQDAKSYPNPTGSFSSVMSIERRDWMNTPTIEQKFSDQISYIEAGGIAYSGTSTGTYSALLACAPGSAPSNRGGIEMPQGLALASQSQLVGMVGNVWANLNSRLPKITMEMSENLGNLDIAPQETVQMNILASDTPANIPVNGLYLPDSITWHYDAKGQILFPSIDFKNLVNGTLAEAINIPASVAEAGFESGFSVPQLQIPPLPTLAFPTFPATSTTGSSCCDYISNYLGLGLGNYDLLLRNNGVINAQGTGSYNLTFPYASNLAMYDPSTGHITINASGTYNLEMYGEWWCAGVQSPSTNSHIQLKYVASGGNVTAGNLDAEANCGGSYPNQGCSAGCPSVRNSGNSFCAGCHGADCNTSTPGGFNITLNQGDVIRCEVQKAGVVGVTDDLWYNLWIRFRKVS